MSANERKFGRYCDDGTGARAVGVASLSALASAAALLGFTLCPTRGFFGIPCPTCGLTRATFAFLHGDFVEMWRLQPLTPLVLTFVIAFVCKANSWRKPLLYFGVFLAMTLFLLWLLRLSPILEHPDGIHPEESWLIHRN